MRSLRPEQILLLLLLVLVPLLNLLVRWLRRRVREGHGSEAAAREAQPPAPLPPRARVIEPPLPARPARQETPPRREAAASPPVHRRMVPLRGRAALGRAIVTMTILGPCRGLEEPAASPPVQRPSPEGPGSVNR